MKRVDPISYHKYSQLEHVRQYVHMLGDTGRFEGRRQWNFAHKSVRFIKTMGGIGKIWRTKKGCVVVIELGDEGATICYMEGDAGSFELQRNLILYGVLSSYGYNDFEIDTVLAHKIK